MRCTDNENEPIRCSKCASMPERFTGHLVETRGVYQVWFIQKQTLGNIVGRYKQNNKNVVTRVEVDVADVFVFPAFYTGRIVV